MSSEPGPTALPVRTGPPPFLNGVRIGSAAFPPVSAPEREAEAIGGIDEWGRFDSPGRTYYVAAAADVAFAEVLSPLKRRLGASDPLEAEAAFFGMTLTQLLDEVAKAWSDDEAVGHDVVPRSWLDRKRRVDVAVEDRSSWVEVEHPDSISAIEQLLESQLASAGVAQLTVATLRADDRSVTVSIAAALRTTQAGAAGIAFGSKHGGGACIAVWLMDRPACVVADSVVPIAFDDPDLLVAAARFGLRLL